MQAIILDTIKMTPLLSGAFFLTIDKDDPRHELLIIVAGMVVVLIACTSLGIDTGQIGQTILGAFMIIVGYWFGQKESEKKGVLNYGNR